MPQPRPARRTSPSATSPGTSASRAQSVSNALNSPDRVAPATRHRILAAVDELGYRPNRSARALRNQRSRLIGVQGRGLARRPGGPAARPVPARAGRVRRRGRLPPDPVPRPTTRPTRSRPTASCSHTTAVDAFVLASTHTDDARVAALRELGVPFATFGRSWDGDDGPGLGRRGRPGRHPGGHRAPRRPGPPPDRLPRLARRLRHRARPAAGLARGAAPRSASSPTCTPRRPTTSTAGRAAAHRLLDAPDPATAIVCASDTLALGAMRALSERGLRAGPDFGRHRLRQLPRRRADHARSDQPRQPLEQVAHDLVAAVEQMLAGDTPIRARPCSCPSLSSATRACTARPAPPAHPARSNEHEEPSREPPHACPPCASSPRRARPDRLRLRLRGRRRLRGVRVLRRAHDPDRLVRRRRDRGGQGRRGRLVEGQRHRRPTVHGRHRPQPAARQGFASGNPPDVFYLSTDQLAGLRRQRLALRVRRRPVATTTTSTRPWSTRSPSTTSSTARRRTSRRSG